MRCDGFGIDYGNQNAGVGRLRGKSAVAADDATNRGAHLFGILERAYQIGTYSALRIATAD